jgi:hypothetical protein
MTGYTTKEIDGVTYWYLNGKLHREDGPAADFASGTKFWYLHGKRHREDGPANQFANGAKWWYLDDVRLTEEEFTKKIKNKKFTVSEIASLKSYGIEVG